MRAIAKTADHSDRDNFAIWFIALGILVGTYLAMAI